MVFLAELNESNIVKGVKMVYDFIDDSKHVQLDDYRTDLIGQKYVDGQFIEEETE